MAYMAYAYLWFGFEAAHVFPLSESQLFADSGLSRSITDRAPEHDSGINSSQNGLLMLSNIHQQFDNFLFSINPDGSVRDELLGGEFRQAVLVSMREAGEPWFAMDSRLELT
ncbi:hypothetical protein V1520DRAFT_82547 [Lipomyces starkeyi]|uniref:HNH nuclease domain-containing protein n=1 Tax=Lipomyces starkeyi NRRL Y-11557 TaxID=675824 RepID=A0A1E3Q0V7_LIPST|nr:hypothetical protein LIPSTDRAFT_5208 [Lipomyces starkeyi NRRL Y-11557]